MVINNFFNFIAIIISLVSAILIIITIISNKVLNQKLLFNEIVKQERELRITLNEYRKEIDFKNIKTDEDKILILNYETLLFGYYEYLAICVYKKLIDGKFAKLFFKRILSEMKRYVFDKSFMFEKGYANKKQYRLLLWLFQEWHL